MPYPPICPWCQTELVKERDDLRCPACKHLFHPRSIFLYEPPNLKKEEK